VLPRQLIVVDDGSTDDSVESVRQWIGRRAAPIESLLLRQANSGSAAARNRGLAAIRNCPLVAFLDSDDLWPADFLERTCRALEAAPSAVAATCDRIYDDCQQGRRSHQSLAEIERDATKWLLLNDGGIASSSLFRTQPVRNLGGFSEPLRTGQDLELFFRLSQLGPWRHVPGQAVTFRRNHAQATGEEANLSTRYRDKFRRIAELREQLVLCHGGLDAVPKSLCRSVLARWWYLAGRESLQAGRPAEARRFYLRSAQWRFWNKAWLRIGQTYVTRSADSHAVAQETES
jgi:glycosyltransferase involved in cell wall biosynthesis